MYESVTVISVLLIPEQNLIILLNLFFNNLYRQRLCSLLSLMQFTYMVIDPNTIPFTVFHLADYPNQLTTYI